MVINICGSLSVSSVPSEVLLECGHFPIQTGLQAAPWQIHHGTVGLLLHCGGELTSGLFSYPPKNVATLS